MNSVLIICAIIIIIFLLCSKQENYFNIFGQYIDGPSDDFDGINMSSPIYRLWRQNPYYWYWNQGIANRNYPRLDRRYWL
jgi:hypothetical protein